MEKNAYRTICVNQEPITALESVSGHVLFEAAPHAGAFGIIALRFAITANKYQFSGFALSQTLVIPARPRTQAVPFFGWPFIAHSGP